MPTFEIDFDAYCKCGAYMCNQVEVDNNHYKITIEPCEKCLEEKYDQGHEDGYDMGLKDNEDEDE